MDESTITPRSNECPLYQLFDLFGKKWTLHIFQSLYMWISTFSWLMKRLPQINSKVLAERLDLLTEKWYVKRVVSQNKPLKINYYLSDEWKELFYFLISSKNIIFASWETFNQCSFLWAIRKLNSLSQKHHKNLVQAVIGSL